MTTYLCMDMLIVQFGRSITQCLLSVNYTLGSLLATEDIKFDKAWCVSSMNSQYC